MNLAVSLACRGCGTSVALDEPYPFRCPHADQKPQIDHVVTRHMDLTTLELPTKGDANPFVRFRRLFSAYHLALSRGMRDAAYVSLVEALDEKIREVDGTGFAVTPLGAAPSLGAAVGLPEGAQLWVKDETGNVSGSHKARHLMGVMIYLEILKQIGVVSEDSSAPLAISSCGNAALAAATVARAANRPIEVFVPTDANPHVIARLKTLHASLRVCERQAGVSGDPCYHAFLDAVAQGALPFSVQGNQNGLAVEGGYSLGYEMASQLGALDHLVIQVGGGALATACIHALEEAVRLGALERCPRIYAVQTEGAYPLARAYARLLDWLQSEHEISDPGALAAKLELIHATIQHAANHRADFMWPWEQTPHSIAHGILDDETYDWLAIVEGMLRTGGRPLVVSESTLSCAHDLARAHTKIAVDATGSAGLAGLLTLIQEGTIAANQNAAVLFTGAIRDKTSP